MGRLAYDVIVNEAATIERRVARPTILAVMLIVGFVGLSGWRYLPWNHGEAYGYVCKREVGLPDGAVGKFYNQLGPGDPPMTADGRVYGPGDYMFLGYCGPDGRLIP